MPTIHLLLKIFKKSPFQHNHFLYPLQSEQMFLMLLHDSINTGGKRVDSFI